MNDWLNQHMNNTNDDEDCIIFYKEEKENKNKEKLASTLYKELREKYTKEDWIKKFKYLMSRCLIPVPENYFKE